MLNGGRVEQRLRRIIAETALIPASSFGPDDELNRSGVDSLSLLRTIAAIESEFAITVPDEEFDSIRTLRGLINAVEKRIVADAA